ncbi:Heterogeneous nuclear ribonucleoprotein L-like protein [Aix galericulata]|nr:Heterogeneous nuclear ribonucleoprotein L-like protein [Aix galericulata]
MGVLGGIWGSWRRFGGRGGGLGVLEAAPSPCPPPQDVLYTICNPCGPVQRIVIFRKNGVQAMSAQRAKASLNGADIYSGCCTLKIEYAKPTRLNVFKNDQDTWDYTNPNLSGQGSQCLFGGPPSFTTVLTHS